ncbi:MAG: hypothetical protein AABX03_03830 [Nanoarchaeota archaeon]
MAQNNKNFLWVVIGVSVVMSLAVSVIAGNITGNAVNESDRNQIGCSDKTLSLSSNKPAKSVVIGDDGKDIYIFTLVSASDTAATIKVNNTLVADQAEISEGQTKEISGVSIKLLAANENMIGRLSVTIRLIECKKPVRLNESGSGDVTYQGVLSMLNNQCGAGGGYLIGSTQINNVVVGSNELDTCNKICKTEQKTCINSAYISKTIAGGPEAGFVVAPIGCVSDFNIERSPEVSGMGIYCTCCNLPGTN